MVVLTVLIVSSYDVVFSISLSLSSVVGVVVGCEGDFCPIGSTESIAGVCESTLGSVVSDWIRSEFCSVVVSTTDGARLKRFARVRLAPTGTEAVVKFVFRVGFFG